MKRGKAGRRTPGVVTGGPFAGQTLWLASFNTLPITCRGWIGYYEGVQWKGNEPTNEVERKRNKII